MARVKQVLNKHEPGASLPPRNPFILLIMLMSPAGIRTCPGFNQTHQLYSQVIIATNTYTHVPVGNFMFSL